MAIKHKILALLAGGASQVANTCLPPAPVYNANFTSLGCYSDASSRTLVGLQIAAASNLNTPTYCADQCGAAGFKYAGVEYTSQCFCGNQIESTASKINESQCNMACSGDSSLLCGGIWALDLLQIYNPSDDPVIIGKDICARDPLCSNPICNSSLSTEERVAGLINQLTLPEKAANMMNGALGVPRLGLPPYQWWNEALHGVGGSPGVGFTSPLGVNFSYATSFPMPILMGATFDDDLIHKVATVVATEGRAFANAGHAGFDFWTPNINPFRDPRWGRGLEVASEDPYHLEQYVYSLVTGLQGGVDPKFKRVIATCKHYAVYDVEENRNSDDLDPTAQELSEYYLPPFRSCARDAKVGAFMCAYNSEYGIPSCANRWLLQEVLRESWGWSKPYNWITSDCAAVTNIVNDHHYVDSRAAAAAVALNAGTDLGCEDTIYGSLVDAVAANMTTEAIIDQSLTRLYSSLVQVGYFNPPPDLAALNWSDVGTPVAQQLAYLAAAEGITLLKNNGVLPLPDTGSNLAIIGPWANATYQMQGNYQGTAPYLVSPWDAFASSWSNVTYELGTDINSQSTDSFGAAIDAASAADYIIFCGGIDTSIEAEGLDRSTIDWPGNQLDLVSQLASLGKPLIVVQFGGGQVDDSALLNNTGVDALVWAGYPGQDGGNALRDVLTSIFPASGRLPVTQYPEGYTSTTNKYDPNLRPNPSTGNPGRTYMWYPTPVVPFGYGLQYTNFTVAWTSRPEQIYDIASLVESASKASIVGKSKFTSVSVDVKNTGGISTTPSDYVALLFLSTQNAGPAPYPVKKLVSYGRAHSVAVGATAQLKLDITIDALARVGVNGNTYLFPGDYTLAVDINPKIMMNFTLRGEATLIESLPPIPSSETVAIEYLGCFSDALLTGPSLELGSSNSPQACADKCAAAGYTFSGSQDR
ncbi:glycoside hydrolase [Thozetella sp. PMI_491]|nr:glycoside hydrolase [Thozetella sp. PMI_491]